MVLLWHFKLHSVWYHSTYHHLFGRQKRSASVGELAQHCDTGLLHPGLRQTLVLVVIHWKKKKLTASRSASSKRCINICHELLLRASGPTSRDCPSPQRCATVPREADHDGRGGRLLQRRAYASRVIRPTLPPELAPARLARLISGFVLSQLLLDICRYPQRASRIWASR